LKVEIVPKNEIPIHLLGFGKWKRLFNQLKEDEVLKIVCQNRTELDRVQENILGSIRARRLRQSIDFRIRTAREKTGGEYILYAWKESTKQQG